MTKQYQLGIVGYGGMADWHHRHLVQVPQVIPYAAYDIDPERNEVAEQNGLITYPDLDSFLADEAIDIVLISCPNNFHADYSIRAMEAGKHVICEKPVTMNSEEMARVIEAKNRTGMHFSAHQNRRWDHDYLTITSRCEILWPRTSWGNPSSSSPRSWALAASRTVGAPMWRQAAA